MSDLDSSTSATSKVVVKPLAPSKVNYVNSSKKDAQNYFKNLSSNVKKPTILEVTKEEFKIKEELKVICQIFRKLMY